VQILTSVIGLSVVLFGFGNAASATPIIGPLANFDVVNNTGQDAYGFEINLEGISKSDISDVFGLNRNFGTPSPGDVERYGVPIVGDLMSGGSVIGVKITYSGTATTPSTTPSAPFTTPGESCWKFGNINYPNVPCDHFGVSTLRTPTNTTYSWLLTPSLTPNPVVIPSVTFTPPPAPGDPVMALIQALPVVPFNPPPPDPVQQNKDNAFWVKITQTTLPDPVDLNQLMGGDQNNNPIGVQAIGDLANKETEIEWQVLQFGGNKGGAIVDEVSKAVHLNQGDESVVVNYQFFQYLGSLDDEGLVDPKSEEFPVGNQLPQLDPNGPPGTYLGTLGAYIGMQIAGFGPQEVIAAAPEPATFALLGLGLAGLGFSRRRQA